MKRHLLVALAALGLLGLTGIAEAQTGITGRPVPIPQVQQLGPNDLIQDIVNGYPQANNFYANVQLLANFSGLPRNYLDNGSLNVQQRGTGIVTCGTTTTAVYGADRWACQANVSSGAGRSSLVTTAALLPTGFGTVNELYRNSGSLAQPICAIQEIPGKESLALAGKTVTLSVYEVALAGLAADNGNVTTLSIIYGTSTDEGIQTPSTSPAITPAWTGIGFVVNQTPITISTVPARYSVTGTVPPTATEVGVEICFTPTTTSSGGVTDGFAWTGAQLEVAPSPTAYEFHSFQFDLTKAQRYYYQITESAAIFPVAMCSVTTANTYVACMIPFPVTMRAAPTVTTATGFAIPTTTGQTALTVCSALILDATLSTMVAGTQAVQLQCTGTSFTAALGISLPLYSDNGTGLIKASADF